MAVYMHMQSKKWLTVFLWHSITFLTYSEFPGCRRERSGGVCVCVCDHCWMIVGSKGALRVQ